MNRRLKNGILIMCGVALAAWIALVVKLFWGKKDVSGPSDRHPKVTQEADPGIYVHGTDEVQVWLLEKLYCTYTNGERRLIRQYNYDEDGLCAGRSDNGEIIEYRFRYDAETHFVTEIRSDYEVNDGEVHKKETLYRNDGQKMKQTEYRKMSNGEYIPFNEMIWDDDGNYLHNLYYDETGSVISGSMTQYDVNGYVIKEETMKPDQCIWKVTRYAECDSEGRATRIYSSENAKGSEEYGVSMEIVYNPDGTREETRYYEDSTYFRITDSKGRETYEKWYDSDFNVKKYQTTEYYETEEGVTSEQKFYSLDTYVSTYIQKYNPEGKLVLQKRIEADGKETIVLERTYDEDGKLVQAKHYTGKTEYTYDEHGNLIKESINGILSSGSGISLVSREYEYTRITIPRSVAEENARYYSPASEVLIID